jgi:hypothetical protein
LPETPPLDRVLDRLDPVFELAGTVKQPDARSEHGLVVDPVDRGQPRSEVVLVGIVEVVRIGAEVVVFDEERPRPVLLQIQVEVMRTSSSVSRSPPARVLCRS